jgi:hypothetical protein
VWLVTISGRVRLRYAHLVEKISKATSVAIEQTLLPYRELLIFNQQICILPFRKWLQIVVKEGLFKDRLVGGAAPHRPLTSLRSASEECVMIIAEARAPLELRACTLKATTVA